MLKYTKEMNKSQSGQALIVVLLIMAVVLTIALSIASRSVTDIAVTKKEEDALRAISAAEAGAEKLLVTNTQVATGSLPSGASFNSQVGQTQQGSKEFVSPVKSASGDVSTIWFVNHDANGNVVCDGANPCFTGDRIIVCWGNAGTGSNGSTTPAVELSLVYTAGSGDASTAKIARATYDPNTTRRTDNKFGASDGTCTIGGTSFAFSKAFNLSSLGVSTRANANQLAGPQFARLRLFYNTDVGHATGISVDFPGNGVLPPQGRNIDSTGTSGEARRRVIVYRPYADVPPIFDYGLFSGTSDLSK